MKRFILPAILFFFPFLFSENISFHMCRYYGKKHLKNDLYACHYNNRVPLPKSLLNTDLYIVTDGYYSKNRHINKKSIYLTFEPRIFPMYKIAEKNKKLIPTFYKYFTWDHKICNDDNNREKMFFPAYLGLHEECKPFDQRKFTCLIGSYKPCKEKNELYSVRKHIVLFYNDHYPHHLTLYGRRGWDRIPIYLGSLRSKNITMACEEYSKGKVLRNHKFCYCYENWLNDQYYISEKILHCIRHRCVPIYLGCSNITEYIPENVFIDARKFSSIEDIHAFLENMDEKTWNGYINAMEKFDQSDNAKLFTPEHFWGRVEKLVDDFFMKKRSANKSKIKK